MTQIKYTLKCPQCGCTRFQGTSATPGPQGTVRCAQCGTSIDLAREKERLEHEARAAVEERLRGR